MFFEPLPPEPAPTPRRWAAPLWDRPSEGTIPAVVAVNEVIVRTEQVVVALELVRVYTNGFTLGLVALANPQDDDEESWSFFGLGGRGARGDRSFPRLGIRFADGRTAGRHSAWHPDARDDRGMPTEPIVRMVNAGGGGSGGMRANFWAHPLPPPGPLDIVVGLPGLDDLERVVTLDADRIISASHEARVIWE